jgi:hypothetical protein
MPQTTGRTVVDDFVKEVMLNYFSISPTRQHVLLHVFLVAGNGYEWGADADGCAVPVDSCGGEKVGKGIQTFQEDYLELDHHSEYGAVRAEFHNLVREWARKNLDCISADESGYIPGGVALEPPLIYWASDDHCLMATAQDNLHPEWRRAGVYFARDILLRIYLEAGVRRPARDKAEQANNRRAVAKWCRGYLAAYDVCIKFLGRFGAGMR